MIQILAYAIAICYGLIQEFYIRDKSARTFHHKRKLDITTIVYVSAIGISLLTAPILNSLHLLEVSEAITYAGLIIMILGIILRASAMMQLGKFYTRALGVTSKQTLNMAGLYKYVRHPGYAGTIIAGIGFALAQGNLLVLVVMSILMIVGYAIRISQEEKILTRAFGKKYEVYTKHTKRLLPFIF